MKINKLALVSGLIVSVTSVTSLPLSASASNLFVANYYGNTISEIVASTTTPITFATGLSDPYGLAFDTSGNLFVSNYTNNTISEIKAGTTTPIIVASGFRFSTGLAFDQTSAVPEPLNILGAVVGVGLFVGLKRKVK